MREFISICLLSLLALLWVGCVSGTQQSNSGTTRARKGPNETVKIGFSMDTLKEERWVRDKQLVEQRAKEVGAELNVQVANGSDSEQIKQSENMLTQGVDVLIVAPHNGDVAASIVEAAHRQGVPVISYDRLIKNSDVDLYISHQVVKMGEMQAQYLLDHVGKKPANFIIVGGSPTDNNALLLHQGQMNVLGPAVQRGDVKIVTDQYAREWQAEAALNIVENALTRVNNQVDAVVCSNDGTARGAIQALEGQNLAGKVLVSGQDADIASLRLIAEGKQTMTIYKSIQPLAFGAVDAALKLARGEQVATTETIDNGFKKVPAILLEPVAVDRNNILDTVVKDGYQKLEAICEGLPADKCPKPRQAASRRLETGDRITHSTGSSSNAADRRPFRLSSHSSQRSARLALAVPRYRRQRSATVRAERWDGGQRAERRELKAEGSGHERMLSRESNFTQVEGSANFASQF